uniref:DUF494 family protein n=1 Tax=Escherichia coli TaxID=562 RepID=UPI001FCE5786
EKRVFLVILFTSFSGSLVSRISGAVQMVIERVLALDNAEFELDDLKWVILMVLFNIPGCENAYQQMEELLFEVNEGMLH